MNSRDSDSNRNQARFATTRWSIVVSAGRVSSDDSREALARLCETYWTPLYAYVRRQVNSVAEAQDLTQSFFVAFLEKNFAGTADPDRGRFRSYLLTAFKNFLSKEWDKARAQKRGGDRPIFSLDFATADSNLQIEATGGLTAEQIYDQQWTITLLNTVLDRLASEYTGEKEKLFTGLKLFIVGDAPGTSYSDVAPQLGLTEANARKTVSRMRQKYRELLREEIAETVNNPDEIEDEVRRLFMTFEQT